MEATELRIGNKVYDTEGKENTVTIQALKYLLKYGGTNHCQVKPIHITEEWLERMGFRKHREGLAHWYTKSCGKHSPELVTNDIGEDAYSTKLKFVFMDTYDDLKFKHIHQIQNLYFALTGKELEIKPKK